MSDGCADDLSVKFAAQSIPVESGDLRRTVTVSPRHPQTPETYKSHMMNFPAMITIITPTNIIPWRPLITITQHPRTNTPAKLYI
jgi:hypothetical protein